MKNIINLVLAAEDAAPGGNATVYVMIALIAVLVVIMVISNFRNKKKRTEMDEYFNAASVGDKVVTVGGIVGKIVEIKSEKLMGDDQNEIKMVVLETGVDKTCQTFLFDAIRFNLTKDAELKRKRAEEAAAREREKAAKKSGGMPQPFESDDKATSDETSEDSQESEKKEDK